MAKNIKIQRNNDLNYSSKSDQQEAPHFNETSVNWRFRVIMVMIVAALGVATYGLFTTLQRYQTNQTHLEMAKLDYQQAQESLAELKDQQLILDDPDYLAQLARRDYFYSKPGEIIFNIESDSQ